MNDQQNACYFGDDFLGLTIFISDKEEINSTKLTWRAAEILESVNSLKLI